ncbi:MAG: heat-inducible transcriptional repressor HrcA [Gammaproteobacteria bacterium]|nr:heat-inducible transcriptional repressor HrcA [Gammaproteobacteria bacterium]
MARKPGKKDLTERQGHLLKVLVERYIEDGQPVGSRRLSEESGLKLSPATIRNVMADLEKLGYLHSPHTSAGRMPTGQAYRMFVDTLVKFNPPEPEEIDSLRRKLEEGAEGSGGKALVRSASSLLSGITHLAGVVTVPRRNHSNLRQIEFLPLSGNRVLSILVVNNREVQNRVLTLDRAYTESELRSAANYLNEQFAGRDIAQVREQLLDDLQRARDSMHNMMSSALTLGRQLFDRKEQQEDFVLAGETNLMDFAELSDVEKLRRLFEAFAEKRDFLHLLDHTLSGEGVQIFIGEESGYDLLDACSVVTSPYTIDDEVVGMLGVIGPTRMAYQRVIPIVDITAKLLGRALNSRS